MERNIIGRSSRVHGNRDAVQRLVPFCHVREMLASRARVVAGGSASEAAKRFTGALRAQTSQR